MTVIYYDKYASLNQLLKVISKTSKPSWKKYIPWETIFPSIASNSFEYCKNAYDVQLSAIKYY